MSGHPQAGIVNRPPEHLLLATLSFANENAREALRALGSVVERELRSDLDPPNPSEAKDQPSQETGELGFSDDYDRAHLTITLGISDSGFSKLGVETAQRPQDLVPIPWGELGDAPPPNTDSGDLVLQICADNLYVCEHVVRRVEQELSQELTVVSTVIGSQRYNSRAGRTARHEGRALIGFLDGTSNLNPRNSEQDAALVFVDPANLGDYPDNPPAEPPPTPSPYGSEPGKGPHFPTDLRDKPPNEPDWTKNGTYLVVRVSTFGSRAWDKLSQSTQEASVGRFKVSGASLDLEDEDALLNNEPKFAAEQSNKAVAATAHIRKANPRGGADDAKRRIFRRGYPLIAAADRGLARGLAFIAFGRTISTQFEFIVRGWMRNPDFPEQGSGVDALLFGALGENVLGGGYYFVPPVSEKNKPWTWQLPF
ncbi:MAG TPA: Dyp-type peroxidase domain-containing protein [Solirubrobacteraceae bacterium]|nr:Dyp-type peroxidase domain-containing protein [Solirubrobacteraceae bacterium]